jgi:kinesin family protein 2/24
MRQRLLNPGTWLMSASCPALQLLASAAAGADAALCCFGQTGSGKSFTMAAVLREAAHQLFGPQGALARRGLALLVSAYEVAGSAAFDLLAPDRGRLRPREGLGGQVVLDAAVVEARGEGQLMALLAAAARARRTASTARNPGSSRSHAFYDFRLVPAAASAAAAAAAAGGARHTTAAATHAAGGSVLFVDLAGSERAADSAGHDAERQAQSAEINSGLNTLKVRGWATSWGQSISRGSGARCMGQHHTA